MVITCLVESPWKLTSIRFIFCCTLGALLSNKGMALLSIENLAYFHIFSHILFVYQIYLMKVTFTQPYGNKVIVLATSPWNLREMYHST